MKNRNLKAQLTNWSVSLVILAVGYILGLLTNNFPFFTFNNEIDASAIVSVIALFVAAVVIPLKINTYTSNRRSQNSIIVAELNNILELMGEIKSFYEEIYFTGSTIRLEDQRKLLFLFKNADNCVDALSEQLRPLAKFHDFDSTISLPFNRRVKPAYTDNFQQGLVIAEPDCLLAMGEMDKVIAQVKKLRYRIYE